MQNGINSGWSIQAINSFAYHTMSECFEHWSFKKGRMLYPEEFRLIKVELSFEKGHAWIKDSAYVGMYWWERNDGSAQ